MNISCPFLNPPCAMNTWYNFSIMKTNVKFLIFNNYDIV